MESGHAAYRDAVARIRIQQRQAETDARTVAAMDTDNGFIDRDGGFKPDPLSNLHGEERTTAAEEIGAERDAERAGQKLAMAGLKAFGDGGWEG